MFYANDEPEGKLLYTETIKLYRIVLYTITKSTRDRQKITRYNCKTDTLTVSFLMVMRLERTPRLFLFWCCCRMRSTISFSRLLGRFTCGVTETSLYTPSITFQHLPPNSSDLVTPLKGHFLSPPSCPRTWSAPSERFG